MKKIESTEHVVHNYFDVVLRKAVAVDVGEDAAQALRVIVHYQENIVEFLLAITSLPERHDNVYEFGREQILFHF